MSKNIDVLWLCDHISQPTRLEILKQVSMLINTGKIPSGAILPPVRELAAALGVSPATISFAWNSLREHGMIGGNKRQGITVVGPPVSARSRRFNDLRPLEQRIELDLTYSMPDLALLPDLSQAMAYSVTAKDLHHHQRYPIIEALQQVLQSIWPYDSEGFMATNSNFEAISLLLKIIAVPGSTIAVEEPTTINTLDIFNKLNIKIISVPCDDEGPVIDKLIDALAQKPIAFIYQPRVNFISNHNVSQKRINEMAKVFATDRTLIIEHDIVGDLFNCHQRSLGLYHPTQTVYIRSYLKTYGADLSLAIVSAPARIIEQIQNYRSFTIGWTSRLLQQALVWLLNDQQTQMHIQHARKVYAERYNALIDALKQRGKTLPHGEGLNLWLAVPSEAYALDKLMEKGILALGGSMFGVSSPPHIRVSTSLLQSHQVDRVADALIEALRGPRRVWRLTCNSV